MFARITKGQSWPAIEYDFARLFNQQVSHRSKGGLTSVYYRLRKEWALEEVLQTNVDSPIHDQEVVDRRATHFSHDFLTIIGYL